MNALRAVALVAAGLTVFGGAQAQEKAKFTLASADVTPGKMLKPDQVFDGFGCTGGNRSPELKWSNAPQGTKSFVVTVYDPDAPTGSGWWHWVVYDLPANVTELPRGIGKGARLPAGAKEARTDFGKAGFGGACPPKGDKPHHYVFTVHALKVEKLDVPAEAALIGAAARANQLGSASLTALYQRQ